jgi:signal transduction histidine kinase
LLFVPITVLHQIRGVLIVINKLYKPSFTENDLGLSLIVISKIVYHLETLYLKNLSSKELSTLLNPGVLKDEKDYESHLSKDILDHIGFGLLIFNQDYNLRYANQFAKSTLKLKSMKKLMLQSVLGDEAFQIIDKLLKNRDVPLLRQEILVNHPGNRQLYLGYSLYNISDNSDKETYAITFMEISQTKRLQAEIIRMDRMASLGVLASGIAHEIRNPLAGIKAMAQTLQEELEEDDSKNEYIERIVRQVNRLDELLKSFFSYARPQRPNPVRSKIPDIVREVLPLFRRKIKDNNIIVKEVYSKSLKEIFVDFHQIEQVFFNLIINAIDAMKEGGTLTIRARLPEETQPIIDRRQRIPKLFSDIYNEITISDTGIGMDSETLNNMYNPFFTTKPNGTGLGLSIVYQIILEHGGQITVDSELDKGTTFKILLPVYINEDQ